jgi:glycosyltransferase involved in cell wall biosynthesis
VALPAETKRLTCERRVAHLHSTLGIYGAERWTLALLKNLNFDLIPTIVISVGTKAGADAFYKLLCQEGFRAFHITVGGKLNVSMILELRRLLRENNVQILHTHGFKADVLGYLSVLGLPIKLVSTIHGWTASEGTIIKAYEALSRSFLRRFYRVYPLSDQLYQQLANNGFKASRLKLILNAVDLSSVNYLPRSRQSDEPFSILFVGRLCQPKGIFDLIEAFALANFSAPATLSIVGDGPDRPALLELAKNRGVPAKIDFVGAVSSIAPWLEKSHVLVLPSYSEGIPRVIMEAFAAGVSVIGTAIPGIQQLVEHEVTGLLVPVGDIRALADKLEDLCSHPQHYEHLIPAARILVHQRFSAQRMARDFEAEYCSLPVAP